MSHLFSKSTAKLREIKATEFGIFSPEELVANSVAEIEYHELYESKGNVKKGGLLDPRLGCVSSSTMCYTCNENINNCPGHFGHIVLNTACYHVGFIKTVKKILECVCHKCSTFRLAPNDARYRKLQSVNKKFQYCWENCKTKNVCINEACESQLLPLRKNNMELYYDDKNATDASKQQIILTADKAREILAKISDSTCKLMGLNPETSRPENMILTVFPVPPMCIRPSVRMDFSSEGQDDLTQILLNIVRFNNELKKCINQRGQAGIEYNKELLQQHVTCYLDGETGGQPKNFQKGSKPLKSVVARLKGKDGRIRGNIMGKRVNFSARTVITGDPNISLEQVGVPRSIAANLTIPVTVFDQNRDFLQSLVDNSPKYPGAKHVIKVTGKMLNLQFAKIKPVLENGDIVERHLLDDDWVVFNRQPTLHKMSMMGHRVKVMPYSTFRLNVNVCKSYNADFDGDEMNLHVPQSLEASAEIRELSSVSKCLVSSQANKPVNSLVQDSLTVIRIFTLRDTFLTRDQVMTLMTILDTFDMPAPDILKPKLLWTGKTIFSYLLPDIDFTGYHSAHDNESENDCDTRVIIDNGTLISGIICSKTVGTSSGGILHIIFNDYGSDRALQFLDETSKVLNEWLLGHGFSVGLGDGLIEEAQNESILAALNVCDNEVAETLKKFSNNELESKGNLTLEETKEACIMNAVAKARDSCGKLVKTGLSNFNNVKQMVDSGSKGSIMNICQISGILGQQIVEGKRLPYGFKNRTLPCYSKFDDSAESRGFVKNSFIKGLTPQEMFFHSQGGREGIIDTAIKTAETGYIQRRLIKAMEDIAVQNDRTVRNDQGDIVQFYYGEDNFDGSAIEWNTFPTLNLSQDELRSQFYNADVPEEFVLIQSDLTFLRKIIKNGEDSKPMLMNIGRTLLKAKRIVTSAVVPAKDLFETFYDLRQELSLKPVSIAHRSKSVPTLFQILMTSLLSTKRVYGLTQDAVNFLVDWIRKKFYLGQVHAGESVGVIAAQSIGEPATQMTLNTFHSAGSGNKTVTSGIPRLKELINAAKTLKTPGMTIYFEDDIRFDRAKVLEKQCQIEFCCLNDLITNYNIIYDPLSDPDLSNFKLNLQFDRVSLYKRMIKLWQVADIIQKVFDSDIEIKCSSEFAAQVELDIILVDPESVTEETEIPTITADEFLLQFFTDTLSCLQITGILGIEKTFISEKNVISYSEQGKQVRKEFVLETDGINLKGVCLIQGVDTSRVTCNDPQEMVNVFGVEVAREILLSEIRGVIADGGSYINYRHVALLCELMTIRGLIAAITRHAMSKSSAGPLSKSTFEQSVDILLEAAKDGARDEITGVSEKIMMGQISNVGTGMVTILGTPEYDPCRPSYLA